MVKNINMLTLFVMVNVIGCIIYVSGGKYFIYFFTLHDTTQNLESYLFPG